MKFRNQERGWSIFSVALVAVVTTPLLAGAEYPVARLGVLPVVTWNVPPPPAIVTMPVPPPTIPHYLRSVGGPVYIPQHLPVVVPQAYYQPVFQPAVTPMFRASFSAGCFGGG